MKMVSAFLNVAGVSCATSFLVISAANAAEPQHLSIQSKDVVVTANRTATTADQTLASVTVITREDIERRQVSSMEDLLRKGANLTIKNDGGRGQTTSLYIRGTKAEHVLVLIDGIKVGSSTLGSTSWQHIPLDQIERVEIVKGPRSSLYGSEAVGGVIQVFTRKGSEGRFNPIVSFGAGSQGTYETSAGASGTLRDTSYNIHLSHEKTDGFDSRKPATRSIWDPNTFSLVPVYIDENDKDEYQSYSGSLSLKHKINNNHTVSFNYLRTEHETESDDFLYGTPDAYRNQFEGESDVLGIGLTSKLSDSFEMNIQLGRSSEETKDFLDGSYVGKTKTARDDVNWVNTFNATIDTTLLFGLDYQLDKVSGTGRYEESSRHNYGYFGQIQSDVERHDLEASVRLDDNEQFGSQTTGSAAWGYDFDNGFRTFISYGLAYRAPTFNDLYFVDPTFGPQGNPDLEPEESRSVEIGISGYLERVNWTLSWFQTHIDNMIDWAPSDPSNPFSTWLPSNVSVVRIKGLEISADTTFFDWALRADISLLDPENREIANYGNDLNYRPSQVFTFNMDRDFGKFSSGLTFTAQNEMYHDKENTILIPGFATVDIRAGYQLTDELKVRAKVDNVLDKDYQTSKGHNQAGMTYFVSLVFQP